MIIQVIRTVNNSTALRMTRGWNQQQHQYLKLNSSLTRKMLKSTLASRSSVTRQEVETEADMFVEPNKNVVSNISRHTQVEPSGVAVPDQRSVSSRTSRTKVDNSKDGESNYFNYKSDEFVTRHIGPREAELKEMANVIGFKSVDDLINATVPASIRCQNELDINGPMTESQLIERLQEIGSNNRFNWKSFIGMGYYNCHTPPVIMRNVLENPGNNNYV